MHLTNHITLTLVSPKQQSLLIIGVMIALSALTWCSVAANAAPQPTLISGVMMAEASPKDVDPEFSRDWLIMAAWVLTIAVQIAALRRKPSVDVDVKDHGTRLESTESAVRLIFKKVDQITETLGKLAVGQGANTVSINDIKETCHSLRDEVTRNDQQVTQQLTALNQRIDGLHAHPRPR